MLSLPLFRSLSLFRCLLTRLCIASLLVVSVLFFLMLVVQPVMADTSGTVQSSPERLDVEFSWLDDPGEPLSLQQAINRYRHNAFQPMGHSIGRGYTLSNSWLSLTVSDAQLNSFDYLWMEPSHLNIVDVYYQTGTDRHDAGSYQKLSLGDHADSSEKTYRHFRMLFPLKKIRAYQAYPDFKALGDYQIFVRVRTNSTHAISISMLSDTAMVGDSNVYLFFYAGFTAIAFILAAFAMFVAYRLRDRVYFWYALYLLTIMAAYMPITGIFFVVFKDAPPYLSDLFSGGGTGFGFFCFSLLSIHLLSADRTINPWLKGYLQLTGVAGLLQAILSPFDAYSYVAGVIGLNAILFSLVLLISFGARVKNGSMGDRFVFSALFITMVGILINFSRLLGWVPENIFTIHAFQMSSLLHMLLLNQAFAERVMSAERTALKAAQLAEHNAKEMAKGMNQELIKVLEQEKTLRIEQERFIDMISHEYRTPLSILKTNLEILELKEKPEWTGRHNLHVMQQASARLQEVFDKTIKGASWKQALAQRHEKREMVSLLDHFMDEAHLMWSGVRLQYDVRVHHAWYKSLDSSLMKTVVLNLIDNARKYSSDPFAIKVSLEESPNGDGLIFTVMNPVDCRVNRGGEELTRKYTRGANSAGTSGLGLGLNLVEQIVEQQGDRLELIDSDHQFEARIYLSGEPAPDEALSSFENGRKPGPDFG